MSTEMAVNGKNSWAALVAALGTGGTAFVVLVVFFLYAKDQGARQDALMVETRRQLVELSKENRDHLEALARHQIDTAEVSARATQQNANAMERLATAVDRVNNGVERISNSGFGKILGAIDKATEAQKQVIEAVKPESKR